MKSVLRLLLAGAKLSQIEARNILSAMLDKSIPAEQMIGLLTLLRQRGETAEELLGFSELLLERMNPFPPQHSALDVCGTGGDGLNTFNISTATALLLAALDVPVAKHGNRSASGAVGSADVIEQLGIPIPVNATQALTSLKQHSFCFLFAPSYHAVLGSLRPIRKALGIPTIFNMIGPMLNPARVKTQLIGVCDSRLHLPLALALSKLGTENAFIVTGKDNMDEIAIHGESLITHLKHGKIEQFTVTPESFELPCSSLSELTEPDTSRHHTIIRQIAEGAKSAKTNVVLINAAAALFLIGEASSLKHGVEVARRAIDRGELVALLNRLTTTSSVQELRP